MTDQKGKNSLVSVQINDQECEMFFLISWPKVFARQTPQKYHLEKCLLRLKQEDQTKFAQMFVYITQEINTIRWK